jgi:hypothetical protein
MEKSRRAGGEKEAKTGSRVVPNKKQVPQVEQQEPPKGFTREADFDPGTVDEWACAPQQRRAVIRMRLTLIEKYEMTNFDLNKHALEHAGIDDVTQLNEEQMGPYIQALNSWVNQQGKA